MPKANLAKQHLFYFRYETDKFIRLRKFRRFKSTSFSDNTRHTRKSKSTAYSRANRFIKWFRIQSSIKENERIRER